MRERGQRRGTVSWSAGAANRSAPSHFLPVPPFEFYLFTHALLSRFFRNNVTSLKFSFVISLKLLFYVVFHSELVIFPNVEFFMYTTSDAATVPTVIVHIIIVFHSINTLLRVNFNNFSLSTNNFPKKYFDLWTLFMRIYMHTFKILFSLYLNEEGTHYISCYLVYDLRKCSHI